MSKFIFITSTDTDAGKTYTAAGLLQTARERQLRAVGIKPVASGRDMIAGRLVNADVHLLQQAATIKLHDDMINPYCLSKPIAPHIAAHHDNIKLDSAAIAAKTLQAQQTPADVYIIEGCGGWHVPINHHETMADFVVKMQYEVVLVIGLRLGCLNHAILTERAIFNSGAVCKGWIVNHIDPDMLNQEENIQALTQWLRSPCLGVIQHNQPAEQALEHHTIF